MVFLYLNLWLGRLCTDADDNDTADTNDADDDDNYARGTNHDYVSPFAIIPNEPKKTIVFRPADYKGRNRKEYRGLIVKSR